MSVMVERAYEQRLEALVLANGVRVFRARLKRELHDGVRTVLGVLADPPVEVATMRVADLLVAQPGFGRVRVARVLRGVGLGAAKTVGGLSERQRRELLLVLRGAGVRG